jgi:hypothetical protein
MVSESQIHTKYMQNTCKIHAKYMVILPVVIFGPLNDILGDFIVNPFKTLVVLST